MQINKENIQMGVAVAVVLLLSLVGVPAHDAELEPEPAIIVDSIDEAGSPVVEEVDAPDVAAEDEEHIAPENDEAQDVSDLLESFDEEELEEEFGDVQTGIDLLDNPLQ